jgi:hypothetical protein
VNSLIATIKQTRPDLLQHISVTASPIPTVMPLQKQTSEFIEGIGEPITALFCDSKMDPTGWYVMNENEM